MTMSLDEAGFFLGLFLALLLVLFPFFWCLVSIYQRMSGRMPPRRNSRNWRSTNAARGAAMLREAVQTCRALGEADPALASRMAAAAERFSSGAELLEEKSFERMVDMRTSANAPLAAHLLREAARIHRMLGDKTPERKAELYREANVLEDVALNVERDPLG